MKKQSFKTSTIQFLATATITAALAFGTINQAAASGNTENAKAAIIFKGTSKDLLTFNIKYNNPTGEVFILELTDDQDRILYSNKFNDKVFDKNIMLKNLGEKVRVNFAVKAGKNSSNQKFDIEPKVRLVEELIVTQL